MSASSDLRLGWGDLPLEVRSAARASLGSDIVDEIRQTGGFSPGLASRLGLADGRRVFAKAINSARNPVAPDLYRREAEIMSVLPTKVSAPALLSTYDDGDWVMLLLEEVNGQMPSLPWGRAQLSRVAEAMSDLASVRGASALPIPSAADDLAGSYWSWAKIAEATDLADSIGAWERTHLDRLVGLESGWVTAVEGDALAHTDLRADNMLLTPERVVFVDWPYALAAVEWLDMLLFLPSVAVDGGADPAQVWSGFAPAVKADDDAVNAVLAAAAGDWMYQSLLPPPLNLPLLRAHQRGKAQAALHWLRMRIS